MVKINACIHKKTRIMDPSWTKINTKMIKIYINMNRRRNPFFELILSFNKYFSNSFVWKKIQAYMLKKPYVSKMS
jgi:hypothetical protein